MNSLFLVILFATFHRGLLIKCYICDTKTNKNCVITPKEMELMDCSIDIIPKTYSFILSNKLGQTNKSKNQDDVVLSITKNSSLILMEQDNKIHSKACIKFIDKIDKITVWGCIFKKHIKSMCSQNNKNYSCQSCTNADGCNL